MFSNPTLFWWNFKNVRPNLVDKLSQNKTLLGFFAIINLTWYLRSSSFISSRLHINIRWFENGLNSNFSWLWLRQTPSIISERLLNIVQKLPIFSYPNILLHFIKIEIMRMLSWEKVGNFWRMFKSCSDMIYWIIWDQINPTWSLAKP